MMHARKRLYPPEWPHLARVFKEQKGWRCERCGIMQGRTRKSKRTGDRYTVYLHAAHVQFNDTLNPNPDLLCLCPTCHGRYDYRLRARARRVSLERRKHQRALRDREVQPCHR